MKEKELAFSDVPNNFLWCINRQCSKAETCLRQLAERLSPEELISCSAINPKHLAKFKNECPYFCSNKQVRYARGFLGILENLTSKQTHFFINRVISNSSRRTYYRVRNGERIIRKSKFPQNPKRSVRFSGKRTKRSVQKRKARNTQKAETKVL